jgi:hypothetical protein
MMEYTTLHKQPKYVLLEFAFREDDAGGPFNVTLEEISESTRVPLKVIKRLVKEFLRDGHLYRDADDRYTVARPWLDAEGRPPSDVHSRA